MMYNLDFIDNKNRDNLLFVLNKRGLVPYIFGDRLYVFYKDSVIFIKKVDELFINDINDILNLSIVDSRYLYYFLDIASDNSNKVKRKKKSL